MSVVQQASEDVVALYDAFAPWYDVMCAAQGRKRQAYRPDVADAYLRLFSDLNVESVLDCACGTGDPLIGLAKRGERRLRLVGSDGSRGMLAMCALNAIFPEPETGGRPLTVHPFGAAGSGGGIELMTCRWEELPSRCGSDHFDVVMCVGHALYHAMTREAMVAALRTMAAVTRPGGYVVFDSKRWTPDLRGELGRPGPRDLVKWRGWTEYGGGRVMFLDSTAYEADEGALSGIAQVMRFYVLQERGGELRERGAYPFAGAPFHPETAMELLEGAGLEDVKLDPLDGSIAPDYVERCVTIIGQKPK